MTHSSPRLPLSALFLAVATLAGCNGGDADAPPAPAPTAQTITFTSPGEQRIGVTTPALSATATSALAVTLTSTTTAVCTVAGTALTLVSAGNCTIEATQAGNASYSAATPVTNTFVVSPASGNTGTCTSAACVNFTGTSVSFAPFENQGGGTAELADDPVDATNRVAKFTKKAGDGEYFGTVISGLNPVVLTDSAKTVTLRVRTPAAGTNFLLKLEAAGGAATELDVASTKADEWETLSFTMPAAGTYSTVVLFPNGRSAVSADKVMYVDELNFPAVSAPPPPAPPAVTFSNGYTSPQGPANQGTTAQGGIWGYFSGDFTNYVETYTGGSFMDSGTPPASADGASFYLAITTSAATTAGYMGMYVTYATGGLSISGKTNLLIDLGMDEFMFQQASNKDFKVTIEGVGTGGCNPAVNRMVTPTSKDLTTYTLALNTFTTVSQDCGNASLTAADVLALPVNAVNSQLDFPNANTTVINGGAYGTGLARGKTAFQ
jgi:hypothetical protein